jgi:class 3 adenylate cyclase/tetratricopeptide (TPR) repeat protein
MLRGMAICGRCGFQSPEDFSFCGACGVQLVPERIGQERRKVVTALFCDVTGSTALGEELDPETLRGVMNRYFADIRATIERHGGTVEKFIGDAVMAVFGIPQVHEDDALRAVRAAAEIRERLPALAQEIGIALRFRTGVNTGPVFSGEGENVAIGDAVNVAARLEQAAAPGEILLGAQTLQLVRDAVTVEALDGLTLKGKSKLVAAFRLLAIDPDASGVARHLDVALVGRARELGVLREAWDSSVQGSRCHLFTVLGVAGVGKSRLAAELSSTLGDRATVLRGRCLPYGEGITFWPLLEALAQAGKPAEQLLERLGGVGTATPEELFLEVRRLLEELAHERPVILHIDDLQWAEQMLFDLLDHVADLSRGAPILLLCTGRPELLEERPGWGGGKLNASAVLLDPLAGEECEALLDQLGAGLDAEARKRVVAASEGNPLFLEEMVALARDGETALVPPSIQALLAARLERLALAERDLLERGAVEGEVFHRLAVSALAGEHMAGEVQSRLAGLVRKDLIHPHPATLGGDEAFRFRHLLIRDAAYEGLPKASRAELHERFADWLESAAGELVELDEIAGWHLEQAVRYRAELGLEVDRLLARRAAVRLHAAGRRASERSDPVAARSLLERALALARDEPAIEAGVAAELAEELIDTGDLVRVQELLAIAEQMPETATLAAPSRLEWLVRVRPQDATETIESMLPGILEKLTRAGDERGLARAHLAAGGGHWLRSCATPAAVEGRLAAEHARKAHNEVLRSRALGLCIGALAMGDTHAREIARALDELEREQTGPYLAAEIDIGRAVVAELGGRFDEARRLIDRAKEAFNELGVRRMAIGTDQLRADIELKSGNPGSAVPILQHSEKLLAEMGERSFRSTHVAVLARAHEQLGDRESASAAVELAEQLSAPEDTINYAITHPVRARLALAEGDRSAAERWARSGVEQALKTDFLVSQGEALLELAHVLCEQGSQQEASTEARRSLALFEAKGATVGARHAAALLERLGA